MIPQMTVAGTGTLEFRTGGAPVTCPPMGNRIREIREERGRPFRKGTGPFTVIDLARRVGVSDKTLRSWEQGASSPTDRHARALARELGVTVEELGLDEADPVGGPESRHVPHSAG
jgi:transcriptional regulator with XRE-family HTH domain